MADGFYNSLLWNAPSSSVALYPATSGEEAAGDAIFTGVSLHSFLTVNPESPMMPTFADLPPFPKLPKAEPVSPGETITGEAPAFYLLPNLLSLENAMTDSPTSSKRPRVDETLDSIVQSCVNFQSFKAPYNSSMASPVTAPVLRSALARKRRQKLSDKTRCLQKLLPWDKNMDMATMLEETFKYVKFLQAQLIALQTMPSDSGFCLGPTQKAASKTGVFSGLGRLNRNQLLQVLVNSQVAQTMLYSQGYCVFSVEQLGLVQKMAERKALLKKMTFDPSSDRSSSSFHGGSYGP